MQSWMSTNSGQTVPRAKIQPCSLLSKSGQARVRLKCLLSAINDHRSMSEGFDHTHFHDTCATVEEPSTASLIDTRLAVAIKPG